MQCELYDWPGIAAVQFNIASGYDSELDFCAHLSFTILVSHLTPDFPKQSF